MSARLQPEDDVDNCFLPPAAESTAGRDTVAPTPSTADQDAARPAAAAAAARSDEEYFLQRVALRPVATARTPVEASESTEEEEELDEEDEEEDDALCSTPVAPECRIQAPTSCPPAPKKPRPALKLARRLDPSDDVAFSSWRLAPPLVVRVSAEEIDAIFQGRGRRRVQQPGQEPACPHVDSGGRKRKREYSQEEEEEEEEYEQAEQE